MRTFEVFPVALLAMFILTSVKAHAQERWKIPRVGVLISSTAETSAARLQAFRDGLREHGLVEGRTVAIEVRYASGDQQLAQFAVELVKLPVDVILTQATGATAAAKEATSTIPIVFAVAADPVSPRGSSRASSGLAAISPAFQPAARNWPASGSNCSTKSSPRFPAWP